MSARRDGHFDARLRYNSHVLRRGSHVVVAACALITLACRSNDATKSAAESRRTGRTIAAARNAPGVPNARAASSIARPCRADATLAKALEPTHPDCSVVTLSDYSADETSPKCTCVVSPTTPAEVAAVVRAARSTGTPLRIRGAAHSANHSTFARSNELLLSTARLDMVAFETSGTVTAGAGVPVVELSQRLSDYGWMLPVVNDGWSGPTVGGYISAGGMGARSSQYGGFWENVSAVTLVDGSGAIRILDRDHADFLWLFGSMGQLGVIVSARLDIVPTSAGQPRYPSGDNFRLSPQRLQRLGSSAVLLGPDMKERLRWFTLLVPKQRLAQARGDLENLQKGFETRLSFRSIYEYEFALRRKNPPLFFGRDGPFVGIGVWAELRPQADVGVLSELERQFTRLVRERDYRRYVQSEVTRGPDELRSYFGDTLYERFRVIKRHYDPDGIINPGTVFAGPRPAWTARVTDTFTSSPALADLDRDGTTDVVIGTGVETRRGRVDAISGSTAQTLWTQDLGAEAYSTPITIDVTGDRVDDVIVGGRMNDLRAFDGATGKLLRSLRQELPNLLAAHLNTPVVVDDADNDGIRDLLVPQSGGNDHKRPPGWLHLVSSKDLKLLASVKTPDDLETYAVPAVRRIGARQIAVIAGTGGETVGGALHRLDISLEENAAATTHWSTGRQRLGFIAGPLWVELPSGEWIVIGVSFDGVVVAVDGETGKVRWEAKHPGFIAYAAPSVGRFAGGDLGVVFVRSRGTSLASIGDEARISWIRIVDGKTVADEALGVFSTSTPLVVDLDNDGFDEVIALTMRDVTSDTFLRLEQGGFGDAKVEVVRFEGRNRKRTTLATIPGVSGGTPTFADLDGDRRLDLLVPHGNGVSRLALDAPVTAVLRMGRYRGAAGDGVTSLRRRWAFQRSPTASQLSW